MPVRATLRPIGFSAAQWATFFTRGVALRRLTIMSDDTADEIIAEMKDQYNTVAPLNYVRTNTLKNSWQKIPSTAGGRLTWNIRSDAVDPRGRHYSQLVVGRENPITEAGGQAEIHQGRWTPLADVVEKYREKYRADAQKIINDGLGIR